MSLGDTRRGAPSGEPATDPRTPQMPASTTPTDQGWPPPMWITANFKRSEFVQPALYGLPETPYPDGWIVERLTPLCQVLEALRAELGDVPITVLVGGGYRTPEWNAAHRAAGHGAAEHSQHIEGRAADIRVTGVNAVAVHAAVLRLYVAGRIPQLGGLGLYGSFVHVDVRPRRDGERVATWRG